jgi:predicted ATPase
MTPDTLPSCYIGSIGPSPPTSTLLLLGGGVRVDLVAGEVSRTDGARELTPTECGLLAYLHEHRDRGVPRAELLQQVWGYAPRVVSRTVDTTVQRLRAKIEIDPGAPAHLRTVRGVGYQLAGVRDETGSVTQEHQGAQPPCHGRAKDIATLQALVASGERLITIKGPGGVGKTTLAAAWAASSRMEVAWVALEGARTREAVLQEIGQALGVVFQASVEPLQPILRVLQGVLVLDNAEHVVEIVAPIIQAMMDAPVQILATSRTRLRLPLEHVHTLGGLDETHAVGLFRQRAQAVRPGFDGRQETLLHIVRRLDCIPLAIELAAGRSAVLSPSDLLARLHTHLVPLLRDRFGSPPPRHATLHATFDWSWSLLQAAEQQALARCAVYRGAFDLADAEAVLGEQHDALDCLDTLHDHSLVLTGLSEHRTVTFRLLQFVREQASPAIHPDARAELDIRYAEHVVGCATREADNLWGSDPRRALAWLEGHADDLEAVARSHSRPDLATRATLALVRSRTIRGDLRSCLPLLEALEGAELSAEPATEVKVATLYVRASSRLMSPPETSAALWELVRAGVGTPRTWLELANLAGAVLREAPLSERALALCADSASSPFLRSRWHYQRAVSATCTSDWPTVDSALEAAEQQAPAGPLMSSLITYWRGRMATRTRPMEAAAWYRSSAELAEQAGFRRGVLAIRAQLGSALHAAGDLSGAAATLGALLLQCEAAGQASAHVVQLKLATVRLEQGATDEAITMLQALLSGPHRLRNSPLAITTTARLGVAHHVRGELGMAQHHYAAALALARPTGDLSTAFYAAMGASDADDPRAAQALLDEAKGHAAGEAAQSLRVFAEAQLELARARATTSPLGGNQALEKASAEVAMTPEIRLARLLHQTALQHTRLALLGP